MTSEDKGQLLMLCGALHDIVEKPIGTSSKPEIEKIQHKIEEIVLKYLPIT